MTEDLEPVTADEPALAPAAQNPPLLPSSAADAPSDTVTTRPLWLAFLAAAGAALIGGLLWAGISIATGYNLGFLALFIGALTGLTAQRVAGAGIGGFERGLSGLFAAGAIILGNYVIFVHEVKDALGTLHAPPGVSVGYFHGAEISEFVHHFGTYVHGFDWFWIAIAAFAAIRTSGGNPVMGIGRTRS
jgi:hypothetical protein